MIIVTVHVECGCSFEEGEYSLHLEGCVQDALNLDIDIEKIKDCIDNYEGEIKEDIHYTFFLHRANIQAPHPCYDPAFAVQQVIEDVHTVNVQL